MDLSITLSKKISIWHTLDVSRWVSFVSREIWKSYHRKSCFFNNFCSINAMLSVTIGDDCIFGENVKIYDHNHCYQDRSKSISKQGFSTAAIQIGRNCWIGSQVTILKGVTIGDNSIIGAGVVVYQDVPENSIILSNGEIRKYG